MKWKPDENILISASYDETIKIWEEEDDDWICAQTLKGHSSTVWALDITNNGKYLASASEDETIKIWDLESKNFVNNKILNVCTLSGYHQRSIYSCSFNMDGEFLATVKLFNCFLYFYFWAIRVGEIIN